MNCRNCGMQIPDDGISCSGCGATVKNNHVNREWNNWVYITFEKYSSAGEYLDVVMDFAEDSEKSARLPVRITIQTFWRLLKLLF
jgi:predicted amidophosphoribosyltransferase